MAERIPEAERILFDYWDTLIRECDGGEDGRKESEAFG